MNKVLIFRTDRIGDLLITCPAIISVKNKLKNPKITIVTSSKNYDYAKNLNIFDNVIKLKSNNIFQKINLFFQLMRKKFDFVFIFDGKQRSIITSIFINSKNKVALSKKNKKNILFKLFNIKLFEDTEDTNLNAIFQDMINHSGIETRIANYNFLKKKLDNNFASKINIKNYIQFHLDEKWFSKFYISSYRDINPNYNDFINFIKDITQKNHLLITTGLINLDLVDKLKNNFFLKKSENIYYSNLNEFHSYLIDKPSFDDIESLLRHAKSLISCHGAITHAASSFETKIIDIVDEDKIKFYDRFTSYIKIYDRIYRNDFQYIKNLIYNKI